MRFCRVVIIEDDVRDSDVLRRFLERSLDIRCDIVLTERLNAGKGEVHKALEQPEDVIVILDLGLSDGTAMRLQAITELRTISESFALYVLTGSISCAEMLMAIEMGADGCWQKPPDIATFVGLVLQAQAVRKRGVKDRKVANAALVEALAGRDKQYVEAIAKLTPRITAPWWRQAATYKTIGLTGTMLAALITALAAWKC